MIYCFKFVIAIFLTLSTHIILAESNTIKKLSQISLLYKGAIQSEKSGSNWRPHLEVRQVASDHRHYQIFDSQNRLLVEEHLYYQDSTWQKFEFSQKQKNVSVEVTWDGKQLSFVKNGQYKTTEQPDYTPIPGPLIPLVIVKNWAELISGKKLPFSVVAPDKTQTYNFELSCIETNSDGAKFQLRAMSGLVRMAVKTAVFTFDANKRIAKLEHGRLPVFEPSGTSLIESNYQITYTHLLQN